MLRYQCWRGEILLIVFVGALQVVARSTTRCQGCAGRFTAQRQGYAAQEGNNHEMRCVPATAIDCSITGAPVLGTNGNGQHTVTLL